MTENDSLPRSGRHRIVTSSGSEYVVDLDNCTLTRTPAVRDAVDDYETAGLRRDSEEVELVSVLHCVVGAEALFGINLGPGVPPKLRRTTPVLSIEELRPADDATQAEPTAGSTPA